jgi:hypothetical protein
MARRTYTLEPQRLVTGRGYVACEPHAAARIVILEITSVPAKGGRKPYRITRKAGEFFGPGALARATERLATLTRGTAARPARDRGIWGRSLTTAEYNAAITADPSQAAVKWQRQPIGSLSGTFRLPNKGSGAE